MLVAASCELQAASTSACAHVDSGANIMMLSMNFKVFVRKAFQRKPRAAKQRGNAATCRPRMMMIVLFIVLFQKDKETNFVYLWGGYELQNKGCVTRGVCAGPGGGGGREEGAPPRRPGTRTVTVVCGVRCARDSRSPEGGRRRSTTVGMYVTVYCRSERGRAV